MTDLSSPLPGIDVESGLKRVAGNKGLYLKLLRQVAGDAPATREKMTAAVMDGDAQAVREIAHSLKGAAGNLSIINLQAAAEQLEMAAKAEDFGALVIHLDGLEQALNEFVAAVSTLEG